MTKNSKKYITIYVPPKLFSYTLSMEPLSTEALQQEGFIQSPRELQGQMGKRFEILNKVGEGSFGMVAVARDRQTGKEVAIKKIKMSTKNEGIPSSALRQISILKSLKHPHIVKLSQVFYDQELCQLWFLLDYHPNNLHELIKEKHPLSLQQIKIFSFQILSSLEYLHYKGIIHRDLKPQNFLISYKGQLRLCDFGQAKYTFFKPQAHTPDISTLWYRAPEILMGSPLYDEKVDIWAAGCIIAELILGRPIFLASSQIALLFAIFKLLGTPTLKNFPGIKNMKDLSSKYPKFPGQGINITSVPRQAKDFLEKMLTINPVRRMGVQQALSHPFLMGIYQAIDQRTI